MRHRTNSWTTHWLTATRRQQTGTDEFGEPIYGQAEVLTDVPVRYISGGTSYVRTASGERVAESPVVKARADLVDEIQEGDDATITPKDPNTTDPSGASFEVVSVNGRYGRRVRSSYTKLELEAQ